MNIARKTIPVLCERFANSIGDVLKEYSAANVEEMLNRIHDTTYNSAMVTFSRLVRSSNS